MILPGHLSAGFLAAHYAKLDEKAALAASLFPDVVDKLGHYVLHITPSGRIPAHALWMAGVSTLLVLWLLRRRAVVLGWLTGYLLHLAGDLLVDLIQGGSSAYLLWPWLQPAAYRARTLFASVGEYTLGAYALELSLTAWAVGLAVCRKRRRAALSQTAGAKIARRADRGR